VCSLAVQYADVKKTLNKSFVGRNDTNDYINAVVVPLLRAKAMANDPPPSLASLLLAKK
jgi:hypothetical protein